MIISAFLFLKLFISTALTDLTSPEILSAWIENVTRDLVIIIIVITNHGQLHKIFILLQK